MQSQILQITTRCSAGCCHCPYGKAAPLEIKPLEFKTTFIPVIITGGEPFEAAHLWRVVDGLERTGTMYRIATGGHVSLVPFLQRLRTAFLCSGVQLGTDVLLSQRSNGRHRTRWLANARALATFNIPYSITYTPAEDVDVEELMPYLRCTRPSFIHLNIEMIKENPCAELYLHELKGRLAQTGIDVRHDPM